MKAKEAKAAKYLYLIHDGESSYKIGSAKNPQSRLNELQVGSSRRLALVWFIQTELAIWIEGYLHWNFRNQQILGEWFSLNAEDVQWVTSLTAEEIRCLWREEELRRLRQNEEIHRQNEEVHHLREDVTGMELAVLQVLWERGLSSRRQIADVLYPRGRPVHFTTVQKLLERLEKKGHVTRNTGGSPISFAAITDREELIRRRSRDVADKLCDGSLTPLLMSLVRAKPPSSRELQKIQDLLHELSKQRRPRNKPR
jgi:BlaI family transcriptional regulator, penicillinase repressor